MHLRESKLTEVDCSRRVYNLVMLFRCLLQLSILHSMLLLVQGTEHCLRPKSHCYPKTGCWSLLMTLTLTLR